MPLDLVGLLVPVGLAYSADLGDQQSTVHSHHYFVNQQRRQSGGASFCKGRGVQCIGNNCWWVSLESGSLWGCRRGERGNFVSRDVVKVGNVLGSSVGVAEDVFAWVRT
jgi:hypothetical protein